MKSTVGLVALASIGLLVLVFIAGWCVRIRTQRPITLSEFRRRLKKL